MEAQHGRARPRRLGAGGRAAAEPSPSPGLEAHLVLPVLPSLSTPLLRPSAGHWARRSAGKPLFWWVDAVGNCKSSSRSLRERRDTAKNDLSPGKRERGREQEGFEKPSDPGQQQEQQTATSPRWSASHTQG